MCGRTARTVRRGEGPGRLALPTPISGAKCGVQGLSPLLGIVRGKELVNLFGPRAKRIAQVTEIIEADFTVNRFFHKLFAPYDPQQGREPLHPPN